MEHHKLNEIPEENGKYVEKMKHHKLNEIPMEKK
jgi:hypothetical protein